MLVDFVRQRRRRTGLTRRRGSPGSASHTPISPSIAEVRQAFSDDVIAAHVRTGQSLSRMNGGLWRSLSDGRRIWVLAFAASRVRYGRQNLTLIIDQPSETRQSAHALIRRAVGLQCRRAARPLDSLFLPLIAPRRMVPARAIARRTRRSLQTKGSNRIRGE